jgi:hypothetical protein
MNVCGELLVLLEVRTPERIAHLVEAARTQSAIDEQLKSEKK